jgi:hypothetical protein
VCPAKACGALTRGRTRAPSKSSGGIEGGQGHAQETQGEVFGVGQVALGRMAVAPASRNRPMAVLRSAASTWGAAPVRTWLLSSSKVTSRTQCKPFSIAQCPRTSASSLAASARSDVRLVMPWTTSTAGAFPLRSTVRRMAKTCPTCGNVR